MDAVRCLPQTTISLCMEMDQSKTGAMVGSIGFDGSFTSDFSSAHLRYAGDDFDSQIGSKSSNTNAAFAAMDKLFQDASGPSKA